MVRNQIGVPMDTKIIIVAIVAIVAVAGVATFFALNNGGGNDNPEDDHYVSLGLTNDYFPDHTCCVVAANYEYLNTNGLGIEKFLAGYTDGVDFIITAMADVTSDDYKWLVDFTKSKVPGLTEKEVKAALSNITYLYGDDIDGSLTMLSDDIEDLIEGLDDVGALTKTVDPEDFVESYVDSSYLIAANENKEALKGGSGNNVTVAVISGDIHQIAIHVAIEKKFFDDYGTKVTISNTTNGAGVATSLINGDAHIGFLGAPPATINMINGGYITSDGVQDAKKAYNLVARVNTEGSGLFVKEKLLDNSNSIIPERNGVPFYTKNSLGFHVTPANAKAWGGLIFATPGTTSIQHIQLLTLASDLGLEVKQYMVGEKIDSNTIYYVTNLANFQSIINDKSVNAGIIWEPQYQRIIQES